MTDQLLTVSEAAEAVNEPESTLRRWILEGVLPVERVGPRDTRKRVRIRLSTLQRMYPRDTIRVKSGSS